MSNVVGASNGARKRNGASARAMFANEPPASRGVVVEDHSAARHSTPTGREVMFATEEILVTKTDLTGHITYANDVFLRVAGYREDELVGQPHSYIRHPEMPRAVFKMLWESIQSGKEIFAYVVNLAASGDHYWVFAHVTPTFDANGTTIGYHSSRRCPDRAQVAKIKALYDRLLAAERGHSRKADAILASTALLDQVIAEHHTSYEEFVFSI
jgi:PAS domain S-box-containing protein